MVSNSSFRGSRVNSGPRSTKICQKCVKVQNILCRLTTIDEVGDVCMSSLFRDFNVYNDLWSNNIRLSHTRTPTDIIVKML